MRVLPPFVSGVGGNQPLELRVSRRVLAAARLRSIEDVWECTGGEQGGEGNIL